MDRTVCFSCLTAFGEGEPLTHPLYPGELVCLKCDKQIRQDYKYMIEADEKRRNK